MSGSLGFLTYREPGKGVQDLTIRLFPGLVNFVPAAAYHFCLNLPATFSQPGNGLIVEL